MKLIILTSVVLLMSGCLHTVNPQHAGDPDYTPDGLVKRPYVWEFKTDNSQKAKDCVLECKKQDSQCRLLASTKFPESVVTPSANITIDTGRIGETDQWIKDLDNLRCEKSLIKCVEDVCKGKTDKKRYLW